MASSPMFSFFSVLPSELRIKIWNFTIPEPRVVPIRFSRQVNQYVSTSPPPPLAHVSPESRAIFLSHYVKLAFSPRYESSVYIDLTKDTVYFDTLDCSPEGDLAADIARSPFRERIEKVAIDSQLWEILRVFKYDCLSEIRLLGGLRTLALVLVKESEGEERLSGHMEDLDMDISRHDKTLGDAIRHVNWFLWSLRWEIGRSEEAIWTKGNPAVQLWLW